MHERNVLFPVLVTFFAGMGGRPWHRLCRYERGGGMMLLLILTSMLGIVIMGFKLLA